MSLDAPIEIVGTLPPNGAPVFLPVGAIGSYSDSAVLLDDGRVLYVWVDQTTGDINQGFATNVTSFITINNSVTFDKALFSGLLGSGTPAVLACVFRAPDNVIYLAISAGSDPTGTLAPVGDPFTLIFTTPDDGVTWNSHGTVEVFADPGGCTNFRIFMDAALGEPFFVSGGPNDGRWVLPALRYDSFTIGPNCGLRRKAAVWTSDDNGVTWAFSQEGSYAPFGTSLDGSSRNIMRHNGDVFWNVHSFSTGGGYSMVSSPSDGQPPGSWVIESRDTNGFSNFDWAFGWHDGVDTMYAAFNGNSIVSFATGLPTGGDPPYAYNEHVVERTFTNMVPTDNGAILQLLGSTMVLINRGQVLGWLMDVDEPCECPTLTVTLFHDGGFESVTFEVTNPLTAEVFVVVMDPGDPPVEVVLCGPFADGQYLVPVECFTGP